MQYWISFIHFSFIYLLIKVYKIHKCDKTSKTEQDSKAHYGSNSWICRSCFYRLLFWTDLLCYCTLCLNKCLLFNRRRNLQRLPYFWVIPEIPGFTFLEDLMGDISIARQRCDRRLLIWYILYVRPSPWRVAALWSKWMHISSNFFQRLVEARAIIVAFEPNYKIRTMRPSTGRYTQGYGIFWGTKFLFQTCGNISLTGFIP